MSFDDSLCFARVRLPSVGTPHGVTGWRPPFDLPKESNKLIVRSRRRGKEGRR